MKMFILIFLLIAFIPLTHASETVWHKVQLIAKIKSVGQDFKIYERDKLLSVPIEFADKKIFQIISHLDKDDEVILKGKIIYQTKHILERIQMTPTLYIEDVRPISFKRLHTVPYKVLEPTYAFLGLERTYERPYFTVAPEVAGSITITASLLLLNSLLTTSGSGVPSLTASLNQAAFMSAGLLATGMFLFDEKK